MDPQFWLQALRDKMITYTDPPQAAIRAAVDGLGQVLESGGPTGETILEASPTTLDLTIPHQVFQVGLDEVADGNLIKAARPTGWRFLVVGEENEVLGAVEVVPTRNNDYSFARLNRGPFVISTAEATSQIEARETDGEEKQELRLLRVPGLYLYAIWLHGQTEILLPLAPAPFDLVAFEPQYAHVLADTLRSIAADRLETEARLEAQLPEDDGQGMPVHRPLTRPTT